jgi:hypothetical protein
MLARKMQIQLDGANVETTPMLVPSLSSRALDNICFNAEIINSIIVGPVLISAYDIHHAKAIPHFDSSTLIFIDSGGYECLVGRKASKYNPYNLDLRKWNRGLHLSAIKKLKPKPTKAIISFDDPNNRESIEQQIDHAKGLFKETNGFLKEFLIKSENDSKIDIDRIVQNIKFFNSFDIIGFIEKELGSSILERMAAIATIRNEMDRRRIVKPLHIFGSLDTITTPLYYFSGADIFDGLAWLRFMFYEGKTLYRDSFWPVKRKSIQDNTKNIFVSSLYDNFSYISELELELEQFQSTNDFGIFGENANFFEKSYKQLIEKIGGDV